MFFRKQTGIRCGWQWVVRRRLPYLVRTLRVFSLGILLLVSYPLTGNGGDARLFGKPTVSVLSIQTFSPAANDQLERTNGILGSRQMIQTSVSSSVMPRRIVCDADTWVAPVDDAILTQILTTRQDRSPPAGMFLSIL
jgi:hypothetical protein